MTPQPVRELVGRVRLQGREGFNAYGRISNEAHGGKDCWHCVAALVCLLNSCNGDASMTSDKPES